MNTLARVISIVILFATTSVSHASMITLVTQSGNWDYNFGVSLGAGGGDNTFSTFESNFTGALNGNGPFGNSSSGVPTVVTAWTPNTALYLQTTVDLTGSVVDSAWLSLAVDNGASVFVNGNKVFGDSRGGFTTIWEYADVVVDTSTFINGVNTISVIANDYGGLTYFDMQMVANVSDVVVDANAPLAALLFSLGLIAVSASARRR